MECTKGQTHSMRHNYIQIKHESEIQVKTPHVGVSLGSVLELCTSDLSS